MNYFDEYTKNYDMTVPEIAYKYYHSYRVMDNMITLAKSQNLEAKDVELAKYIGLLHDIGRFEQFKEFKTFKDIDIDHGTFGETILRENNALSNFDIPKEDYEVVYKSIRNHNKFVIEPNLNKRELFFAKMIRDADKLDILYALGNPSIKWILKEDSSRISDRVKNSFYNHQQCKNDGSETKNDDLITIFSFVYDINFNASLKIIESKQYYEKIYERLRNKELFKPYFEYTKKYIKERTR